MNSKAAAGLMAIVGLVCVGIAVGGFLGWTAGFLFFGVIMITIALAGRAHD